MIYTGKYENCKSGNLISISGDRGKKAGFNGDAFPMLAPKKTFWKEWEENIGKKDALDNTKTYITEYYRQVLIYINIEDLYKNGEDPVLLCYEDSKEFCHRHVLADYLELKYGIKVDEIEVDEYGNKTIKERPKYIRYLLLDVISECGLEVIEPHYCEGCENFYPNSDCLSKCKILKKYI